uniref:Serine/threonine specific protein phosphatases domain-containing protein n=1 Tax=Archaeoglobus fulgidus TaxID=2234 RepID=A0A7C2S5Y2_ARCFL
MDLLELIDEAISVMPNEKMVFIEESTVTVIGDIHADLEALKKIEKEIEGFAVFLGDYADRGEYPVECYEKVLRLFLDGKAMLLRGNHESTGVYPHQLPYQLREKFGSQAEEIYESLVEMWKKMPLSAIVEGEVWMAHGGVPTKQCRIESEGISRKEIKHPDELTALEIMWNDPWEKERCGENYNRGVMYFFGTSASDMLLEELGVKVVIRSHEPQKVLRVEQGGRVVTVGSCAEPYYLSEFAVLKIDLSQDFKNGFDLVRKFGYIYDV